MDAAYELKEFRVVRLKYDMEDGFSGRLSIRPEVTYAVPQGRDKPLVRCRYELDIKGEGDQDGSELTFHILGQGIFELKELPQEVEPGKVDQKALDPLKAVMEEKLIQAVEQITTDFGIPPLKLKVTQEKD